jgi:hypothetical protein
MGGCLCGGVDADTEKDKKFGGADRPAAGPNFSNRYCTDPLFCILFIACLVIYVVVVLAGYADGNPKKLYMPRDFRGDYCGVARQWNAGPNLYRWPKVAYAMNVTATVRPEALKFVCSSVVEKWVRENSCGMGSKVMTCAEFADYERACCYAPTGDCPGSPKEAAGTAFDPSINPAVQLQNLQSNAQARMDQFQNPTDTFFSGEAFTNMFQDATKYMTQTCTASCDVFTQPLPRKCVWEPAPDDKLRAAWMNLKDVPEFHTTMAEKFTFGALSKADCPYSAPAANAGWGGDGCHCVPNPGVTFTEMPGGYCQFRMEASAQSALGATAASSLQGLAASNIAGSTEETFGSWLGEVELAAGAIIVTGVVAFVVGFVFLIVMRFFIGAIVYLSLFFVFILLVIFASVAFVRSGQCAGTSLLDSGRQVASATANTASNAATHILTNRNVNFFENEKMTGFGFDYRGMQQQTIYGKYCQAWDCSWDDSCVNSNLLYTSNSTTILTPSMLTGNFCRNPTERVIQAEKQYEAFTIWCFTDQASKVWESCAPIGVIQPQCQDGYEVQDANARKALEIIAYVIWALSFLWLVMVWCLFARIRLAIAICRVAGEFIGHTKSVLLVPVVLAILAVVWCILWAFSATFLISQVPDARTSTAVFSSYTVAYGDATTPGECTGEWPVGSTYRDDYNCEGVNCWRCAPPRYVFDYRFAIIFFAFLWNNAFMVAFGQLAIAISVAIWFFAPHNEKTRISKVKTAIWACFRYHLGSIAFGSFIVAVVQFIRYVLMYFEKQAQAQKNKVMVIVLKIAQCCLYCLEKCIKFLNKNAYIQIALCGKNFCASAKVAFFLILRNAIRFGMVAGLGGIVSTLGYVFVTVTTAIIGYFILKGMNPGANPILPVVIFAFLGYMVGRVFMAVFMLACDTSLQCYLVVEEAGGQPGGVDEMYVPSALANFVSKIQTDDKDEGKPC